jgi:predicted TIM-barrel fold metal-dependent hydrolase
MNTLVQERPQTKAGQTLKVIDVDTHWSEPEDLWTSRAPARWKDRVPQKKIDASGQPMWTIDGDISMGLGSAASVVHDTGRKALGTEFTKWGVNEVHPACSQVGPRLEMMDAQGIWAHVLYPNVLGFAGQGRMTAQGNRSATVDPELRLISTQIYNDAGAEMQEQSGGRMLPQALLPWWDIRLAVAEAERCFAMGMTGVNINSDPHLNGMLDLAEDYWTPLWELCSDKGAPINFHIGASDSSSSWFGNSPWPSFDPSQKLAMGSAMMFIANSQVIGNIIISGLLERFPKLKFVSVESGVGWLPFLLEALEYQISESGANAGGRYSMSPLEYFRRNIYSCFWFESEDFAHVARRLGIDNVMFESDFPHPTCLYPDPMASASKALSGFTDEEKVKVLSSNAARCYGLDLG